MVKDFPLAGETIHGLSYMEAMGGKGANQAIAAHRLGGDTKFITSVGDDANGRAALEYYRNEELDVSSSQIVSDVASGTALIMVDQSGENCIVVTPGANDHLLPEYIADIEHIIREADILLLQMEIPYETVKTVAGLANRHDIDLFLNVAPAKALDAELIGNIDVLIVNQTEAETITGQKFEDTGKEKLVDQLLSMGVAAVVLTLGSEGCYFKNDTGSFDVEAYEVDPLDTTGAGDTFCGALVAQMAMGQDWKSAIQYANAAAALCVTKMGAQPSIPTQHEVNAFLSLLAQPSKHTVL